MLSRDDMRRPSFIFDRRAQLDVERDKLVAQIADLHDSLAKLDEEQDVVDLLVQRILRTDPEQVVRTTASYRDYAIGLVDGVVECRPIVGRLDLDELDPADVAEALAEHERLMQIVAESQSRTHHTRGQIREAALRAAAEEVFGAHAATAIFDDDDDEPESIEPKYPIARDGRNFKADNQIAEDETPTQPKHHAFPASYGDRDVRIANGVAVIDQEAS